MELLGSLGSSLATLGGHLGFPLRHSGLPWAPPESILVPSRGPLIRCTGVAFASLWESLGVCLGVSRVPLGCLGSSLVSLGGVLWGVFATPWGFLGNHLDILWWHFLAPQSGAQASNLLAFWSFWGCLWGPLVISLGRPGSSLATFGGDFRHLL